MSSPRNLLHGNLALLLGAGLALFLAAPLAGQNVITNGEFTTDLSKMLKKNAGGMKKDILPLIKEFKGKMKELRSAYPLR